MLYYHNVEMVVCLSSKNECHMLARVTWNRAIIVCYGSYHVHLVYLLTLCPVHIFWYSQLTYVHVATINFQSVK